jgi:hypothetical protein
MVTEKQEDLLTSGGIAKELGVSDAKVKKAITELALQPKMKKGVCCYYSKDAVAEIKGVLK